MYKKIQIPMSKKRESPSGPQTDQITLDFKKSQEDSQQSSIMRNQHDIIQRRILKVKKLESDHLESSSNVADDEKQHGLQVEGQMKKSQQFELLKDGKNGRVEKNEHQDECGGSQKKQTNFANQSKSQKNNEETKPQPQPQDFLKTLNPNHCPTPIHSPSPTISPIPGPSLDLIATLFPTSTPRTSSIFGSGQPRFGLNLFKYDASKFNDIAVGKTPLMFGKSVKGRDQDEESEDNEDEENSQQLQNHQILKTNPLQSTSTYTYPTPIILLQSHAQKLKKSTSISSISSIYSSLIQHTILQIQSNPQKSLFWLTILLSATKVPIMTGYLVKNKSEVKYFGGMEKNVVLSICVRNGEKMEMEVVMVQFEKDEEGRKFLGLVREIVGGQL